MKHKQMQHHSSLIADQQTFRFTVSLNELKKRSPSSSTSYTYLYKRFGQRGPFNYVLLIFCDSGKKSRTFGLSRGPACYDITSLLLIPEGVSP